MKRRFKFSSYTLVPVALALSAAPSTQGAICIFGKDLFKNRSLIAANKDKLAAFTRLFDYAEDNIETFPELNKQFEHLLNEFVDGGATEEEFTALSVYMVESKLRYMRSSPYQMYPTPNSTYVSQAFEIIGKVSQRIDLTQEQVDLIGQAMETRGKAMAWDGDDAQKLKNALQTAYGRNRLHITPNWTKSATTMERTEKQYKYMRRFIVGWRWSGSAETETFLATYRNEWTPKDFTSVAKRILKDSVFNRWGPMKDDSGALALLELVRKESKNYALTPDQIENIRRSAGWKPNNTPPAGYTPVAGELRWIQIMTGAWGK